jgi:hypothetical protein
MIDSRIATGIRVGSVAAAATIGAVIGLGLRHGLALRPFTTAGRALLEKLGLSAAPTLTALTGLAMVVCAIVVLGVCFTVVAASLRGVRLLGAAVLFGAIGWAVSVFVVPSILALSSGIVLGNAQRVFVFGMLSAALVAGIRLARPSTRIE